MSLRVLFAGGGTGGHLFPGIAVAEELQRRNSHVEICFATTNRPIEKQILAQTRFRHRFCELESTTSPYRHPVQSYRRFKQASRFAREEIVEFHPAIIIGLGGFISFPFVLLARRQKCRVVILEQNIIVGRATWLNSYRASQVCLSYPQTKGKLSQKCQQIITGNPIRESIRAANENSLDTSEKKKLIILGGSQGARNLNSAVLLAMEKLQHELKEWEIFHQTGELDRERVENRYQQLKLNVTTAAFFDRPEELYRGASLAISRAGATTLAELACIGCPAILIPYPHATHNHQLANARYYESNGAAVIIPDRKLECDNTVSIARENNPLAQQLQELLRSPELLNNARQSMSQLGRPEAARDVVDVILG
ncbi:MAG: UDP-N-acetylglucosamine--N-acetylmuramyl-(pentapeptide) pyrophosphoryl-undecaprenol N-acetylglucosamine transferase [Planctomycetaceae bacterium]|nr:UDP-N-acetylglucosamine--N-acetylmuramyl-(pentapeptide) pyrophosphoryl-undecaprenol N-acetylglucosamine transferase [Planctomycetaceae bacterium]